MTLITCISPDVAPVFFSDTLLSSQEGRSTVVLPSIGASHSKIKGRLNLKTWGYEEKIVIVGDNLIIAWAGELSAASQIIHGIANYFRGFSPALNFVEAYLHANHAADLERVSLIFNAQRELPRSSAHIRTE